MGNRIYRDKYHRITIQALRYIKLEKNHFRHTQGISYKTIKGDSRVSSLLETFKLIFDTMITVFLLFEVSFSQAYQPNFFRNS